MSSNPYQSPDTENQSPKTRSLRSVIFGVAACLGVAVLAIALLLPASRGAREAARRSGCSNNVKQIMLALEQYHSVHGAFPPAYTVDEDGNRLHSWRTLILPYAEHSALYATIDLSKPWNDPANAAARQTTTSFYTCPNADHPANHTTYLAVVGSDGIFSGPVARKRSEVTDGSSNTIAVIDAGQQQAVHWMSPYDTDEATFLAYNAESPTPHPGVLVVGLLDGAVVAISLDSDKDERRALLTVDGNEPRTD